VKEKLIENKELIISILLLLSATLLTLNSANPVIVGILLLLSVSTFYISKRKLLKRATTNKIKTIYLLTEKVTELTSLIIVALYLSTLNELGYLLIASFPLLEIFKNSLRNEMRITTNTLLGFYERTTIISLTLVSFFLNEYLIIYGAILYILLIFVDLIILSHRNIYLN